MTGTSRCSSRTGASSTPATRSGPSSSGARERSTPAAATAQASTSPTGARTGSPLNPCGDPPGGVGAPSPRPPPRAARCAARTSAPPGDPVGLDGAVIRVDPATGAGCRQPARVVDRRQRPPHRRLTDCATRSGSTERPGTDELWIGDVGWNDWEEINRLCRPPTAVGNFGWPCYEGAGRQAGLRRRQPQRLREAVHAARCGRVALLRLSPHRLAWCRTRPARRAARRWPGSVRLRLRAESVPGRVRRRALLRRLLPRLHLGDAQGCRRQPRTRPGRAPSSPAPRTRSTSRSARAGSSTTSTSTVGPCVGSATPAPTSRRSPTPRQRPPRARPRSP